MDGTRAPQGLDAEDKIALGLGAAHLIYLVVFAMAGWAILSSPLPLVIRAPGGFIVLSAGAVLAWGRAGGRPLDRWLFLFGLFLLRTRQSAPARVEAPEFATDVATAVRTPSAPRPSPVLVPRRARRIAFYSQGGGSGKTTLAFETAALVASLSRARVALVDMDFVSSTMRARSGLRGPDVGDVLAVATPGDDMPLTPSTASIEQVLQRHPAGMRVVLGPTRALPPEVLTGALGVLFDHLDEQGYEVVVVDIGTAAVDHGDAVAAAVLDAVDAVYCVFNPTAGGVMGAYRAVATLRRLGLRRQLKLIANRHDRPVSLDELTGDLRLDLLASVPTLPGIAQSETSHMPACLHDEAVSEALYGIAEDIYPDMSARWFSGAPRGQVGAVAAP